MKTLSELLKLSQSPEGRKKLSIILAPLVGWSSRPVRVSGVKKPIVLWFGPNGESNRELPPDFHLDLNACAVVENGLDFKQQHENEMTVMALLHGEGANMYASALQRTISLILVLQNPNT